MFLRIFFRNWEAPSEQRWSPGVSTVTELDPLSTWEPRIPPQEPIWRIVSVEGVVTFLLVLVVVSVATDSRVPAGVAALAIGSALAAAILISGPISGAGVNPTRALGPMIVASKFTDWWAYIIAPLIGGTLAITAYDRILRGGSTPI